jgi:hypothetical protein
VVDADNISSVHHLIRDPVEHAKGRQTDQDSKGNVPTEALLFGVTRFVRTFLGSSWNPEDPCRQRSKSFVDQMPEKGNAEKGHREEEDKKQHGMSAQDFQD